MTETKRALITGVAGQGGSYLAELLVAKGYEVHGIVRRHAVQYFPNIQHLLDAGTLRLQEADLTDLPSLEEAVASVKPHEVYNLAAQSHVGSSFTQPEVTMEVTGQGALRVFQAVRMHAHDARVYQASSSEMYGNRLEGWGDGLKLDEAHPFHPVSPYGAAKVYAHHAAQTYRIAHGMHISCGILFNHESQRRGALFLTRKVTLGLARIKAGKAKALYLGNLDAVRDWGYAPEYMEGAWRMLQQDQPGDWVLATGEGHTVAEWVAAAGAAAGFTLAELGAVVQSVPEQRRPTDIHRLVGNAAEAKATLGWEPKVRFKELVGLMVRHDLDLVAKGAA